MCRNAIAAGVVCCVCVFAGVAHADEDIFADYYKDTQKPAEAKSNSVYKAWGDNMGNLIEKGARDGVVIKGNGDYAGGRIHADGVGNVTVDKDARVGPIINKTEINNAPVIIRNRY